ncbi:unnamed protein product, partial [Adineta steineri]
VNGRAESLSPLSSVSSSPTSSIPSSRRSSYARSPRYLPPLNEEHNQSQKEQNLSNDQLIVATKDDGQKEEAADNDEDDDDDEDEEKEEERFIREKKPRQLFTPLKPREYSQFSGSRRSVSTTTKARTLLRTPKHKGPPGLPARRTRTFCDIKSHYTHISDDDAYNMVNRFTFNDFILHATTSDSHPYEETTVEKAFLSKYTYKQICEMIAERVWAERGESGKVSSININILQNNKWLIKIHVQTLVPDIEPFQNRIPMHQIVAEMALVLRQHMSQILGSQFRMNIRTLPSWRQKEGAHTEILLYEAQNEEKTPNTPKENNSSFEDRRDTGAQIAVLDSLIKNGTHLDLRAFTLEYLPDISLMFTTLVALDLSYNCLQTVPLELFECTKLEHLYLRHNPILSISSGMNNLETLVFLDMSFCELRGSLPESLFGLINLRHLDISYNRVTEIPSEIANLKNLRQLLCDGNEISYFPSSMIGMTNLRLVTAKNTWLLPQFAKNENSTKPQKLLELLTVHLSKYQWEDFLHKIPDSSKLLLS